LNFVGKETTATTTASALRLNEATKSAFGQDYQIRIQKKKLKQLMWLCEQPFLGNPTSTKMQRRALQQQQQLVRNFTLQKEEALYLMVELYDLPKRISFEM
jgi:hypothetical protein